jgi:ATP synthase F1 complex assembly factor 2
LHKFVEKRFDHAPVFAQGTIESMLMARKRTHKPQVGLPHPPTLYEKAEEWTHGLDAWHLVALHSICMQAKSFMVGVALLEQHHLDSPFDDMSKAMDASRVEEEFQIANWGLVEGQHDYDRLNCSVQLHSAQILAKTIAMEFKP